MNSRALVATAASLILGCCFFFLFFIFIFIYFFWSELAVFFLLNVYQLEVHPVYIRCKYSTTRFFLPSFPDHVCSIIPNALSPHTHVMSSAGKSCAFVRNHHSMSEFGSELTNEREIGKFIVVVKIFHCIFFFFF